jgi:hypothetical protein
MTETVEPQAEPLADRNDFLDLESENSMQESKHKFEMACESEDLA